MVEVKVPDGMTQEAFEKAMESFIKQRVVAGARDKAIRAAMKDLIAAHKPEYDTSVEKYMKTPKAK